MNKKLGLQGDSGAETGFNFLLGLCTSLFMLTCTERPRSWDSIGMWLCNGEMIQGNVTCLTFLCAFGEYLTLIPIPKAGFWAWGFLCFTNHLDSCPCKHSVGALWQTLILFRALSITAGGMWVSVSKWCCTAPSLQKPIHSSICFKLWHGSCSPANTKGILQLGKACCLLSTPSRQTQDKPRRECAEKNLFLCSALAESPLARRQLVWGLWAWGRDDRLSNCIFLHMLHFERIKEGWNHWKDQAARVFAANVKNLFAACALALSGVASLQVEQCCQADESISAAWMPWDVVGTD